MDIQPQSQQTKPISDDQELAKVLAGIKTDPTPPPLDLSESFAPPTMPNFGIPTIQPSDENPVATPPALDNAEPTPAPVIEIDKPAETPVVKPSASSSDLDGIKKMALTELRPLVDKLNLEPEEKFDIYLLLLRSTDDTTLIAPAHDAAKEIADESKRAQALLDVIKEIDFLSTPTSNI